MSELIQVTVEHTRNYSTISLRSVEDARLSLKAKALHVYLITRPPGWQVNNTDLENRTTDGKHSIEQAKKELVQVGYLSIHQNRDNKNRITGTTWTVYEIPKEELETLNNSPQPENQDMGKMAETIENSPQPDSPAPEFPAPGNQTLNNKHSSNNHFNKSPAKNAGKFSSPNEIKPWALGLEILINAGDKVSSAQSYLGMLKRDYGMPALEKAIQAVVQERPENPKACLKAICQKAKQESQSYESIFEGVS